MIYIKTLNFPHKLMRLITLILLVPIFLSACSQTTEKIPVPVEEKSSTIEKKPAEIIEAEEIEVATPERQANDELESSSEERQGSMEAAPVEDIRQSDPVVIAFLDDAEKQVSDGNIDQAIISLERAVRIKPKEPWLWHQLAVLKMKKELWQEAITLAQKSIALSGQNETLLAGNWQVIARSKRAMGDESGAKQADDKVRQYQATMQG